MNGLSVNQNHGEVVSIMSLLQSALVKETVAGSFDISVLPSDFYKQISKAMPTLSSDEFKEVKRLFEKITSMRLKKIQSKATFGPLTDELASRLTDEETVLYNVFYEQCFKLKNSVMKGEL